MLAYKKNQKNRQRRSLKQLGVWLLQGVCHALHSHPSSNDKPGVGIALLPRSGIYGHFWCQKQVLFKTKYKSHARSPAIGQRHIVPVFGLKRPGTPGFVYFV